MSIASECYPLGFTSHECEFNIFHFFLYMLIVNIITDYIHISTNILLRFIIKIKLFYSYQHSVIGSRYRKRIILKLNSLLSS